MLTAYVFLTAFFSGNLILDFWNDRVSKKEDWGIAMRVWAMVFIFIILCIVWPIVVSRLIYVRYIG